MNTMRICTTLQARAYGPVVSKGSWLAGSGTTLPQHEINNLANICVCVCGGGGGLKTSGVDPPLRSSRTCLHTPFNEGRRMGLGWCATAPNPSRLRAAAS